jgi:hypothetical protein
MNRLMRYGVSIFVGWAPAHHHKRFHKRRLLQIPPFGGQEPTLHVKRKDSFGFAGMFLLLVAISHAQILPAPQAGTWHCTIFGLTTTRGPYTTYPEDPYNSLPTFSEAPLYSDPTYYDSSMGDLILDGNGNYTLTGVGQTGTYQYNAQNGEIIYSGFLASLKTGYALEDVNAPVIGIYGTDGTLHTCRLTTQQTNAANPLSQQQNPLSANTGQPAQPTVLNSGIQGKLLVGLGSVTQNIHDSTIAEADIATATAAARFTGAEANVALNGDIVYVNPSATIIIANPDGSMASSITTNWDALNDGTEPVYPALSANGQLLAFVDKNPDSYGNPTVYESHVVVSTRANQVIATFPNFTQPAWTPDNRLVMVGSEGLYLNGLYITDASLSSVTRLDPTLNGSQMPAVSPDGKLILFINTNALWSMNLDGSNQRTLDNTARISWPVFSRDGRYVLVIIADPSSATDQCLGVIVTSGIAEGTQPSGFIVTDANGQPARTTCSRVVWR